MNTQQIERWPLDRIARALPDAKPLTREQLAVLLRRINESRHAAIKLLKTYQATQEDTLELLKAIKANQNPETTETTETPVKGIRALYRRINGVEFKIAHF